MPLVGRRGHAIVVLFVRGSPGADGFSENQCHIRSRGTGLVFFIPNEDRARSD